MQTLPGTLARSSAGMVSVKLKMCHQLTRSTDANTCMWRRNSYPHPCQTQRNRAVSRAVKYSRITEHGLAAI